MADYTDTQDNTYKMDAGVPDYGDRGDYSYEELARDRFPIRSVQPDDLNAIIRIDAKHNGQERRGYFEDKFREILNDSGIRVSLVAEVDGMVAGFIMARLDYGEYGHAEGTAIIDTLGVNPGHAKQGIGSGLLSQLLANLGAVNVESVRTNVAWTDLSLLGFLQYNGFKPAQTLLLSKKLAPVKP